MKQGKRVLLGYILVLVLAVVFPVTAQAAGNGAEYQGMDYSDVYDYEYYKEHNPDLAAAFGNDRGAYIAHFVENGMAEGRVACADFDVQYYKVNNPDLFMVLKNDLKAYYVHYMTNGKIEGRSGSAHAVYEGMDYSDVYDYSYYRSNNPDLEEAFGNDTQAYIRHFVEIGMSECRVASEKFNVNIYIENYPDLQQALGNDYKAYYVHYMTSGKTEGRVGAHRLSDMNGNAVWMERGGVKYCLINGEYATGFHEIDGRWYYFNQSGELCSKFGIDVSSYNGDINWQAAKADGVEFAIIRIGYGENLESQDDVKAVYNMMACEWLQIPYGVYLYSYALTEADVQSEVDHVLRMLNGRRPELGVYIDMEDADGYKSRRNALDNTTLQNICMQFVDTFTSMGYQSGIYANLNWMNKKLGNSTTSTYPNWIAQWGVPCEYMGNYVLWQSSSNGSVNGINGRVDIDAWIYRQ